MDFFVFFWSAGTQLFKDPVKGLLAVVPALHFYVIEWEEIKTEFTRNLAKNKEKTKKLLYNIKSYIIFCRFREDTYG